MDIGHIGKAANRKRLLDDIQKVGDKVSKENAELVKLQIANDTAFWEMKEKLAQKESEHEKLQQNMVTLQMQYETLSAKYQEELRLRPEVLNKLNANRKIYEVLQEHMERLMESISRTKADKVALYDAYMKSDKVVRDLKQTHINEVEKAKHRIEVLQRTVTMSNEHQSQLTQVFSACKQQAEADLRELKNKLEAIAITKDELTSTVSDLNRKLDISKFDVEKRDEKISTLQRDMKEMINSFNGEIAEARAILVKKEKELKSNTNEIELLKGALANQESFTKDVRNQNSGLQETLAELEENYQKVVAANDELKVKIKEMTAMSEKLNCDVVSLKERNAGLVNELNDKCQGMTAMSEKLNNDVTLLKEGNDRLVRELNDKCQDMTAVSEKLNSDIASLKFENEDLVKELNDKCEVLSLYESDLKKCKEQISAKDEQIKEISEGLNNTIEDSRNKSEQIHSLATENDKLNKIIGDKDTAFENYREASEDKVKKLKATIEEKNKELDTKAGIIIQAMMELENNSEQLASLEKELQNVRREKELEIANAKERESKLNTKIAQLEAIIKSKDEELSLQISKFLEMRNKSDREKTSLREKHNALQLKLDNIRKETVEETHVQPDDNAVLLTPDHGPSQPLSMALSPVLPPGMLRRDSFEDMLSSSDHCADGDSLDSQEISRRFAALARGQPLPPVPPAMLKRRREDTPVRRHFASLTKPQPQLQPQPRPQLQPQTQTDRSENVFTVPQQNVKKERRFFKSVNYTDKNKKRK